MTDDAMWVPPRAVFGLFSYNELVMLGATREACERVRDEQVTRHTECCADLATKGYDTTGFLTDDEYAEQYSVRQLEVQR